MHGRLGLPIESIIIKTARIFSHSSAAAILAFTLQLLVLVRFSHSADFLPDGSDMQYYSNWGLRIAHGQYTDHLAFYGLPGYAYLLGAFYSVLGFDPFTVALAQAFVFAGIATIIFKLARRVTCSNYPNSPVLATAAGWFAASGWMFFVPAET